jgi:hypothetical protein
MGPDTRWVSVPLLHLCRTPNRAGQRRIGLSLNGEFLEGAVTYVLFPFAHWAYFGESLAPGPKCGCRVMAPNDRPRAPIVQADARDRISASAEQQRCCHRAEVCGP